MYVNQYVVIIMLKEEAFLIISNIQLEDASG